MVLVRHLGHQSHGRARCAVRVTPVVTLIPLLDRHARVCKLQALWPVVTAMKPSLKHLPGSCPCCSRMTGGMSLHVDADRVDHSRLRHAPIAVIAPPPAGNQMSLAARRCLGYSRAKLRVVGPCHRPKRTPQHSADTGRQLMLTAAARARHDAPAICGRAPGTILAVSSKRVTSFISGRGQPLRSTPQWEADPSPQVRYPAVWWGPKWSGAATCLAGLCVRVCCCGAAGGAARGSRAASNGKNSRV
jgi:hypothetical protein